MQPAHHRSGAGRESPRLYRSVFDLLKRKIDTAELPHGCRVREGQIASILDVSRGPVRHAIGLLLKEGALRETDGQKVVAGAPAHHTAMTTQELRRIIIDDSARDITRKNAWENIFAEARHQIISCLPFGTYRVMEAGLARHYNVSRTVAREVLARLSDVRLIEKNRRSHWIAGPLTARDLAETMSMRILLEPHALALAARDIDAGLVTGMKRRVLDVLNSSGPHDRERFCMLENDLHHILLQKCGNRRLVTALERNQLHESVEALFNRQFGTSSALASLRAHCRIFDLIERSKIDEAQAALTAHLEQTAHKLRHKLRVLSVIPKPATVPWLIEG